MYGSSRSIHSGKITTRVTNLRQRAFLYGSGGDDSDKLQLEQAHEQAEEELERWNKQLFDNKKKQLGIQQQLTKIRDQLDALPKVMSTGSIIGKISRKQTSLGNAETDMKKAQRVIDQKKKTIAKSQVKCVVLLKEQLGLFEVKNISYSCWDSAVHSLSKLCC